MTDQLKKITITRDGVSWLVTRERDTSGETARCANLEECFKFVRALYDEHGEQRLDPFQESEGR